MRLLLLALLFPLSSFAAEPLYIEVAPLADGSLVSVYLSADANGNAVEGVVSFAEDVEVADVMTGESVVQYWLETPKIVDGEIVFSGVIPGGFSGVLGGGERDGLILAVRTKGSADAVRLTSGAVYQNDGAGTRLAVVDSGAQIVAAQDAPEEDVDAPEWFEASRLQEDGRTLLVLSAVDKESGIAHFEVAEGFGAWAQTTNPYELADKHGWLFTRARAVDNSGNSIETFLLPSPLPLTLYILILIVVLALLYWNKYRRTS